MMIEEIIFMFLVGFSTALILFIYLDMKYREKIEHEISMQGWEIIKLQEKVRILMLIINPDDD